MTRTLPHVTHKPSDAAGLARSETARNTVDVPVSLGTRGTGRNPSGIGRKDSEDFRRVMCVGVGRRLGNGAGSGVGVGVSGPSLGRLEDWRIMMILTTREESGSGEMCRSTFGYWVLRVRVRVRVV